MTPKLAVDIFETVLKKLNIAGFDTQTLPDEAEPESLGARQVFDFVLLEIV